MTQMILVPLDGSPYAEQAIPPACRLARQTGAAILLLQATSDDPLPAGPDYPLQVSEREAGTYLRLIQQRLRGEGIAAYTEVCRQAPQQAIATTAHLREVDVIAMCSHGRSGPRQTLCGSVAQRVIADPPAPLLLARTTDEAPANEDRPYKHILVPLDGTVAAEEALDYLQGARIAQGAVLTLLRVVSHRLPSAIPDLRGYSSQLAQEQAQFETQHGQMEAYRYLDSVVRSRLRGISCRTRAVVGLPAKAILDVALAERADVIVLTAGAIGARPVRACVSWHVLNNTQTPVLLLRPSAVAMATHVPSQVEQKIGTTSIPMGGRVAVLPRTGDDD